MGVDFSTQTTSFFIKSLHPSTILLSPLYKVPANFASSIFTKKMKKMLTIILLSAGALCFWLFFKSIDFFEKI